MNDSNTINKGSLPGLKEKRYLQKNVETLAAREILSGEVQGGDTIVIDALDGKLVTRIEHDKEQA